MILRQILFNTGVCRQAFDISKTNCQIERKRLSNAPVNSV